MSLPQSAVAQCWRHARQQHISLHVFMDSPERIKHALPNMEDYFRGKCALPFFKQQKAEPLENPETRATRAVKAHRKSLKGKLPLTLLPVVRVAGGSAADRG